MILQSIKMAWSSIITNKMRSLLTMLGIIIGVFALVVLVSLVSSATNAVTDSIASMGTNQLTVTIRDNKEQPLKLDDLYEFAANDEIGEVAPIAQSSLTIENSYASESATVYGTTPSYKSIQNLELSSGRFIKNTDIENHTRVAIISNDVATEIMGRSNVLDETIRINGSTFLIIGIMKDEEFDSSSVYEVYIPFTSLTRLTDDVSSEITTFYVSSVDEDSLTDAENAIFDMLLLRLNNDSDAFNIRNQSSIMETMASVTNTMSILLGGIAAISLIVGGIGIMNIMLVSVTERTREIGIRKAIGAERQSIMKQFLIEALMLSLMGCLVGILISFFTMQLVNILAGVSYQLSFTAMIVSVLFSIFIGLVFGIYPANKAAKKNPIEALRYSL